MEQKIKKLKDLRVVRECALNYDYVPEKCEASELVKEILPDCISITVEALELLLDKYEGSSVDNIDNYIIRAIDEL